MRVRVGRTTCDLLIEFTNVLCMSRPISPLLLEKYLNDTCTEEERQVVEAWYASLQGDNNYLDSLSETAQVRLQKETFERISENIPPVRTFRVAVRWVSSVAAGILLVIGIYGYLARRGTPEQDFQGRAAEMVEAAKEVIFENNEPRIVTHRLPDGTTVWLHSQATIVYPASFWGKERIVEFRGEGFFDVAHDKDHPFIVESGELRIEVLGTKFNVKAISSERIFEVSVLSGSVSVSAAALKADKRLVVLKAKEQAFFETQSRRLMTAAVAEQEKKEIYEPVTVAFDGTALRTVVEQLERRFDVKIRLAEEEMNTCRLTADFEEQPLPVILDMLCTSLDATYTMSGKLILIDGAPCH